MRSLGSLARTAVAAVFGIVAAAAFFVGTASAHPGHAASTTPPTSANALNTPAVAALFAQDVERPSGRSDADTHYEPAETDGNDPAQVNCIRSCCAGGTPCAGAFAVAMREAALVPPVSTGAPRDKRAAHREGITPQALPKPPRSLL